MPSCWVGAISFGESRERLRAWTESLKIAMFLTGSIELKELKGSGVLVTGQTAERMRLMGLDPSAFAARP